MPDCLFFESYNNIYKFLFTGVAAIPYVFVNFPVLIPTLFIGYTLYVMKSMSIIRVYKKWVYFYSGVYNAHDEIDRTKKFNNNMVIDSHILNASIHEEIVFESLPMFIIELINNIVMLKSAIPYGYVPVAVCALNVLSGVYHIFYYRIYWKINIVDIPIKIDIMGLVLINMNEIVDNRIKSNSPTNEGLNRDAESLELTDLKSSVSASQLQRIVDLENTFAEMGKNNDKRFLEITERLSLLENRNVIKRIEI